MHNKFSKKSILDTIISPKDLKKLSIDQLEILSEELRSDLIDIVSKTVDI